jgi:hypothetical protein
MCDVTARLDYRDIPAARVTQRHEGRAVRLPLGHGTRIRIINADHVSSQTGSIRSKGEQGQDNSEKNCTQFHGLPQYNIISVWGKTIVNNQICSWTDHYNISGQA